MTVASAMLSLFSGTGAGATRMPRSVAASRSIELVPVAMNATPRNRGKREFRPGARADAGDGRPHGGGDVHVLDRDDGPLSSEYAISQRSHMRTVLL